ncbi:uncharacterized protein METZ01_LOCUS420704, partial [marine metagenome]
CAAGALGVRVTMASSGSAGDDKVKISTIGR